MGQSSSGSDTYVSGGVVGGMPAGLRFQRIDHPHGCSPGKAPTHNPSVLVSSSRTDCCAVGGSVPGAASQRQGSLCQNRATPGPARDLQLSPLSLQTLLSSTVCAAAPFMIPVLFFLRRLLHCIRHKGFSPRDPRNPIHYRRVGGFRVKAWKYIFHVNMPLRPIMWHHFILLSTGLMTDSFADLYKSLGLQSVFHHAYIHSLSTEPRLQACTEPRQCLGTGA